MFNVDNACTLVPTVFRWHKKMEFKFHFYFSFFFGLVKWNSISISSFRFLSTCDIENGFEFRFSFFVFAALWKGNLNFNACTLVPTVFRWHKKNGIQISFLFFVFLRPCKMEFHSHFYFSFFVYLWHWKTDLNFLFRFSFFVFAALWKGDLNFGFCFVFSSLSKTDLNFVFRICIACYWQTDWSFICHFCMNLKSGLIHVHQLFETRPPPPPPKGMRMTRGLSVHNHPIFIPW